MMDLETWQTKSAIQRFKYLTRRSERRKARDYLRALRALPCTICRVRFPLYKMEIDHTLPQEHRPLAAFRSGGWPALTANLWDTQVLCCCCHARVTWERSRQADSESV